MDRPFSAFGVLLGFLALTMFAVSSTSRSTTVKPVNGHADRAALRRQVASSRLNNVAAANDSAGEFDSLDEDWLCTSGSIDGLPTPSIESNPRLSNATTLHLAPVIVEVARSEILSPVFDDRTYDPVYDRVVLGLTDAKNSAAELPPRDSQQNLSAAEVTALFQSLVPEKLPDSRNANRKLQRRAATQGNGQILSTLAPAVKNWLAQQLAAISSPSQSAGIEWNEYAELMDRATRRSTTSAIAVRICDAE